MALTDRNGKELVVGAEAVVKVRVKSLPKDAAADAANVEVETLDRRHSVTLNNAYVEVVPPQAASPAAS